MFSLEWSEGPLCTVAVERRSHYSFFITIHRELGMLQLSSPQAHTAQYLSSTPYFMFSFLWCNVLQPVL